MMQMMPIGVDPHRETYFADEEIRSPMRAWILAREMRTTTSSGEPRRFRGGDELLDEDTWGRGHSTRTVDAQSRKLLVIAVTD
jgi:hypothetical protein